jgi:hypothetical protein
VLTEQLISDRRAASSGTPTQCSRCGAPTYAEPRCRECGPETPGGWRWGGRDGILAAALLLAAFVASCAIAIYKDGCAGPVLLLILVVWGPGALIYGITLNETEHRRKPTRGEEGYVWLTVVGLLPLWMARLIYIAWGSLWTIALVSLLWPGSPATH